MSEMKGPGGANRTPWAGELLLQETCSLKTSLLKEVENVEAREQAIRHLISRAKTCAELEEQVAALNTSVIRLTEENQRLRRLVPTSGEYIDLVSELRGRNARQEDRIKALLEKIRVMNAGQE